MEHTGRCLPGRGERRNREKERERRTAAFCGPFENWHCFAVLEVAEDSRSQLTATTSIGMKEPPHFRATVEENQSALEREKRRCTYREWDFLFPEYISPLLLSESYWKRGGFFASYIMCRLIPITLPTVALGNLPAITWHGSMSPPAFE